jgi:poly(hydroxyalkanoate) depolymerase family esterase
MKWSREMRIARRSIRTALKAASAMAAANLPVPPRATPSAPATFQSSLSEVKEFGSNPGRLRMLVHQPAGPVPADGPLIVLLHGCGQSATSFAAEGGWIALTNRLAVPLVLPVQSEDNNQGRCFNWFRPMHTSRGQGEALSIRQMVSNAVQRFRADPERVFVAGLSAGAAMAAALLASYPEVFAAGSVCAGLPVGAANGLSEALRRMAEAGPSRSPEDWADAVRRAGPEGYRGPWPRLSIWQGGADRTVDPENARLLAVQWATLHGVGQEAALIERLSDVRHAQWQYKGNPVVELWNLDALGHEWPPDAAEAIARFWEIAA